MKEGNVVNDVDFLAEIMDMNETVQNGSDETLTKIRIQVEGNKLSVLKGMHTCISSCLVVQS